MLIMHIKIIMERIELRVRIVYEKLSLLRTIIKKTGNIDLGSFGRELSHNVPEPEILVKYIAYT